MPIRQIEDKTNKHLSPLARNTISILGQTIGHIKKHDDESKIFQILSSAIMMLTSILKPYVKDDNVDLMTGEVIDDRLKN
jgi:hypothetical protein